MKKTVIIGNIGQDAQVKTTQAGQAYLAFTVAVTEKRNQQEVTTWFSCSGWGERFTGTIAQYIKKGGKIYIEGNYSPSIYQAQDGSNQISHNLMINQIELLGSAQAQAQAPVAQAQAVAQPQATAPQAQQPMAQQPIQQPFQQPAAQPQGQWTAGSGHTDDAPF